MSKARSWLYKLSRVLGDVEAVASGDRKKVARRAKNELVGRLLGIAGFWRRLWR